MAAVILDFSKDSSLEGFLCNQLLADLHAESLREAVEQRKKEILAARFAQKKAKMDSLQRQVVAESDTKCLTQTERKTYNALVKMEMPAWTYFQIMLGTGDDNFWSDDKNREKFLRDNPEYSPKGFK